MRDSKHMFNNILKGKDMEKQVYITDNERKKCQKVADAFAELYENEDVLVIDTGNYGFLQLQYFRLPYGFDTVMTFVDSMLLFDSLLTEWLNTQLIKLSEGTPMEDMDYEDIFKCMPPKTKKEFMDKQLYFAEKAGMKDIYKEKKVDDYQYPIKRTEDIV